MMILDLRLYWAAKLLENRHSKKDEQGTEAERSVATEVQSRYNSWYQNNNFDVLKASVVDNDVG
jgi:hypothetical protein